MRRYPISASFCMYIDGTHFEHTLDTVEIKSFIRISHFNSKLVLLFRCLGINLCYQRVHTGVSLGKEGGDEIRWESLRDLHSTIWIYRLTCPHLAARLNTSGQRKESDSLARSDRSCRSFELGFRIPRWGRRGMKITLLIKLLSGDCSNNSLLP